MAFMPNPNDYGVRLHSTQLPCALSLFIATLQLSQASLATEKPQHPSQLHAPLVISVHQYEHC